MGFCLFLFLFLLCFFCFLFFFFSLLQISFCLIFLIALSNKINNLFVSVALIRLVLYLTKDNFIKMFYSVLSSLIK